MSAAERERRYAPPDGLRLVYFAVLVFWVVVPIVIRANPAQDATPYVVAGDVVSSDPGLVYASRSGDLYDLDPAFARRSCELVPAGCGDAVAFVSTPAAVPFAIAVNALGVDLGVLVMRLVAAASLAGGMVVLWNRLASRTPGAARTLVATVVLLTPFAIVPIALGQTSPVLFASAAVGLAATARPLRCLLTAALWVATVVLKAFPAALVVVLLWQRRWRVVRDSALVAIALVVLTLVTVPTSVWSDFLGNAGELSASTTTNPYNGSIDALVHQLTGWDGAGALAAVLLVARVAAAVALGLWALRRLDEDAQWSYAWLLLLLVVPLVWWHYLWLAIAAVGLALAGRRTLDDRTLLVLPAVALATVPISIPYSGGHALPVLQALFLVAAVALVPVLRWREAAPSAAGDATPTAARS